MTPAMGISVRPAAEQDVPAIHKVIQAAFTKLLSEPGSAKRLKALEETEDDIRKDLTKKRVLVCECDGTVVGSLRYHVVMENIAYLSRFGVLPEFHGRGIGGALVDEVVRACKEQSLRAIALHTSSAVHCTMRFYYRMGFFAAGISVSRGYYRALMVKELVKPEELIDYAALFENSGL
jgi:predicted N-acetyltransferase YhbS